MSTLKKTELPPELDPSQGDAALEHQHLPGEQPGKRHSEERNDPEVQPGASDPPET
ncbi:MAG: hypothetical protein ABI538_09915 [Pseudoxanthomonas sp.]